jgi:GLEYA domain
MRNGVGKLGGIHSAQLPNTTIRNPYIAGIYRSQYTGWPNQNTANPAFFNSNSPGGSAVATNFDISLSAAQTGIAYQWLGYFKADWTGVWTFATSGGVDDAFTFWIGSNALSGYTTGNALINVSDTTGSNTISLTAGTYYPIRAQFANNQGPGSCGLTYTHTGISYTDNWTGKLFYNPATNGF